MNKSVCDEQAKQKRHHDGNSKSCEYFVGKIVLVHRLGSYRASLGCDQRKTRSLMYLGVQG